MLSNVRYDFDTEGADLIPIILHNMPQQFKIGELYCISIN